ncbi:MAG: hypothetical protein AB7P49_07850, partial [Bdellovibrionales bacterium]
WGSAYGGTDFARSQNGVALYAYLLYQNGLPYMGVEMLFRSTNPKKLHSALLNLWTTELNQFLPVQKGWITATKSWTAVINSQTPTLKLSNLREVLAAFRKADQVPAAHINQKARIWWQIATRAPQIDRVDEALKALKLLQESGQVVIGKDLIQSAYARVLYQKGDIEAALDAYSKIPKSSTLWVESVEEKAWAHLRRDHFDKALGEVITLLSPALSPLVGPESYYVANLLALKVCDYPRIFKNSERFKKSHRERLSELQDLAKTGTHKNLNAVMERFNKGGVQIEAAGPLTASVPRAAFRDARLVQYVESRRALLGEVHKAQALVETVSALGGEDHLTQQMNGAQSRSGVLHQLALKRLRVLAKNELEEYRKVLNRMHIVEAEVIQRLHVDENLKGQRHQLPKVKDSGDVLVFPYTSDEVWFDELGAYKAQVKDCPSLKEASL